MGRNVTVGDLAAIRATSSTANTQNEVSGTVTLDGQGILIPSGGVQLNVSGPVIGSGKLVNAGSGTTVLLNGANNWLGGTTISNGTLSVGNGIVNGSLPTTPALISNYGTLLYNVVSNTTVTPLQEITGPGGLTKRGDGILALTVSNSFTGPVNTGTGTPLAGGIIQFLNHAAFGDPSVSKTVSVIRAEVQLSGVAQIPPTVYLQTSSMSNSTYPGIGLVALRNVAGNTTISNTVELIGGAGSSEYSSDAGLLTFAGPIFLGNTSSRSAIFSGLGNGVVNSQLSDQGTNALTVEKNGPGTWTLTAANVYGGPTLVRAGKLVVEGSIGGSGVTNIGGTLGGTGTIYAPVIVQAAGTLAPGNSPGTLTINNNLTLQGTTVMEIGRNGGALTHDQATVGLTCFYGGSLVITNVGSSPLQPGDSFQVFAASARSGSFANIIYPDGYNWTSSLAADGRISVVSVIGPSNPPGFPPGAVATLPDGNISITATGAVGTAWSLRATNDLTAPAATWPVIQSGTIGTSPFTVEDLGATNYDKRFYLFSTP
jgi:autotransporter-associated beta strand protein